MSREWTEAHILELIEKNATDGKGSISDMLRSDVGLELKCNATWPAFQCKEDGYDENMLQLDIDIPEKTILLPLQFAEMIAGQTTVEAPIELTIPLLSPFRPVPPSGFLGYIVAPRPIRMQIVGGWIDYDKMQITPDFNLLYPDVEISPMLFNNLTDGDGHLLHITPDTHTIYIDGPESVKPAFAIDVYRVAVDGLVDWPSNGFHFHTVLPLGVTS